MDYISLKKMYYKTPELVDSAYNKRFEAESTRHIAINIKQYNRQRSFPAFLCYTEMIPLLMEKIYHQYETLLYVIHRVPPVVHQQFSLMCIVDEVKSTNDIEGVHSTKKEIKSILDGTASHSARLQSVVNKYKSILSLESIDFTTCHNIRAFYDDFAHEEVVYDNPDHRLDGEIFRKFPVDITSATGKTIHRGLHPEDTVIATMSVALQILHDETYPFLVRLALFHYFFAYIHPFYDGNGRTDRFITSYYLGHHLHPFAALRLSVTMKRQRKKYYDLFEECDSELNRGDMTPFVHGFLDLVADSLEDTTNLLTRKNEQLNRYHQRLKGMMLGDELTHNIYYILLQAALFYGQGVTIQQIMDVTKKSRGTIQKRLDQIPPNHIIKIRSRNYFYKLNMRLFK